MPGSGNIIPIQFRSVLKSISFGSTVLSESNDKFSQLQPIGDSRLVSDTGTTATSGGTTVTAGGTTATAGGTIGVTAGGTTATSGGTTATAGGKTVASGGTTAKAGGTPATAVGTTVAAVVMFEEDDSGEDDDGGVEEIQDPGTSEDSGDDLPMPMPVVNMEEGMNSSSDDRISSSEMDLTARNESEMALGDWKVDGERQGE